jgi:hypothetical protein
MPIHDWTRVDAGTFHDFHQQWITGLCQALNAGGMPRGFFAMLEQRVGGPELDVVALQARTPRKDKNNGDGGTAVIDTPPRTRFVEEAESVQYAKKADRIAIHHRLGKVVAFIELVSPGNKGSQHALRAFMEKAAEFLEQGIHLLVVDLFPPSKRDPQGIHRAIWEHISETKFKLPRKKPLTLASYSAGIVKKAYVEAVAVGDAMPDMPLFLEPERYVRTPLEATYQTTWDALPEEIKELFVI